VSTEVPTNSRAPKAVPPQPAIDWMSEAEREQLVDEYLGSENGKALLRMPASEARRQMGRVAQMLLEQHQAEDRGTGLA